MDTIHLKGAQVAVQVIIERLFFKLKNKAGLIFVNPSRF
jgi:hypothetical protein